MNVIYCAGPYSNGDVAVNVRTAIDAGAQLIQSGFAVIVPHTCHFMHIIHPQDYESWMAIFFELVTRCDGLYRIPGFSPGADREVEYARQHGIPVFHSLESVCRHFEEAA